MRRVLAARIHLVAGRVRVDVAGALGARGLRRRTLGLRRELALALQVALLLHGEFARALRHRLGVSPSHVPPLPSLHRARLPLEPAAAGPVYADARDTFLASGPFAPSAGSYSTFSFSSSDL